MRTDRVLPGDAPLSASFGRGPAGFASIKRKFRFLKGLSYMSEDIGELNVRARLMMTPGPCSVDPRVYRALASPLVGHMDPWFTAMMGEVQTLLRRVFQTQNRVTFPISASGSGGIEAAVFNPLEPGDEAII